MNDLARETDRQLPLELVRGISALGVFFCHVVPWMWPSEMKLFAPFLGSLALAWVMIFFLLSGVVNRLSLERRPMTRGEFVARRLRRLYPVYFGACLFSLLVDHLLRYPTNVGNLVALFSVFNGFAIAGLPKGVVCNSSIWSLTAEFIFYIIFLFTMLRGRLAYLIWAGCATGSLVAVSFFSIPPTARSLLNILTFSGLWLLGFSLASRRNEVRVSLTFAAGAAAIGFMLVAGEFSQDFLRHFRYLWFGLWMTPFFFALLGRLGPSGRPAGREIALLIPGYVFAASVNWCFAAPCLQTFLSLAGPFLAILVSPAALWLYRHAIRWEVIREGILTLGKYSYALYLVHLPVWRLSISLTQVAWQRLIFVVVLTAFLTWVLEAYFQKAFLFILGRIFALLKIFRTKKTAVSLTNA